jgi:uncharacterized membrane protein YphA (DoxX/SURF4 family)
MADRLRRASHISRGPGEAFLIAAIGAQNMTALFQSWGKWSPQVLSIVRIVAALSFLEFGLEKYFGFPGPGPEMNTLLYVQGVIEIVGGLLLFAGAYTRIVAFILSGDMAVAYFTQYFPRSFFPGEWRCCRHSFLFHLLLHRLRGRRTLERRPVRAPSGLAEFPSRG